MKEEFTKVCEYCGKTYVTTNVLKTKYCNKKCKNKQSVNNYRRNIKRKAVEYLGGKCSECGYSKCVDSLHFHHKDPNEKDFGIAKGGTRKWEDVKVELDKCIMVCANCHGEIHYDLK